VVAIADFVDAMSDEALTNEAIESIRRLFDWWNSLEAPPVLDPARLADDFVFEDRRSTINFGQVSKTEWPDYLAASWSLSNEPPQRSITEVLAVRGQRCAAFCHVLDLGGGSVVESIHCIRFAPDLRVTERNVQFDIGDRDAAIAELDRMHAEIDD
jgi:hypothetical protein